MDAQWQVIRDGQKTEELERIIAEESLDAEATDREVLQGAGKATAEIAKAHAKSELAKYRVVQDRLFKSDFARPTSVARVGARSVRCKA